jgi:two-component system nitrogen regulation sensor histidine kinase NtrY
VASLRGLWERHRRENRFLVVAFLILLILSAGAFYLLERTQEASGRELTNRLLLFLLWYLDISLILVLTFILLRSAVKLVLERRAGILGTRFRTKLILTYVGLTFVPVVFIFLIATNLLQHSIDRWFSSPVEEILSSGKDLAVELRELMEQRLEDQAGVAAVVLAEDRSPEALRRLHSVMGIDAIELFEGPDLVEAITDPREIPGVLPPLRWQQLPDRGARAQRWGTGLLIRAWAPIGDGSRRVVVGAMLPRELLRPLEDATAADAEFQQMKRRRGTVTSTTILVFLSVTLLLLFATVWIGLYLSRRFTEPLLAVADATRRVAEGDALEEVDVVASDEVGILVDSFNAMVRRVRATEAEILSSNRELETLLGTIPTGVLTMTPGSGRFRPNDAAARMLGRPEWSGDWHPVEALDRPGQESLYSCLVEDEAPRDRAEITLESGGTTLHLDVTRRPLVEGGSVVAMDDLTQLVLAQRHAAWSEVARRIAHEIKNPLTPIRLAAERIQRRASEITGPLTEVLSSSCAAIIAHVTGLQELVDSFQRYARMPEVEPRPADLAVLAVEVTSLYEGLRDDLEVVTHRPEGPLWASVDPVLLRQAMVNLVDNAVDAIQGGGTIRVRVHGSQADAVIEVEDSGCGLPTDDLEMLTRPFFSTKGRGSGMGLAIVHRVVQDHGGSLEVGPSESGGARFRIVLPGVMLTSGPS